MLWGDDDFITVNDLISRDPELTEAGEVAHLTFAGDNGLIRRGKEEAQAKLSRFMSFASLSPNDLSLRNINRPSWSPSLVFNYAGFSQIVVSGESESNWSALKQWAMALTLKRIYTAAVGKAGDRYADKLEAIDEERRSFYWPNFRRRGVPICFNPLDAPGAIMGRCGSFTLANNLALVAGAGTVVESYDFAITWVGTNYVSPTAKHNGESYRSRRLTAAMGNGTVARVSTTGLTAPNGQQPAFTMSSSRYSPGTAIGWNVWACKTPQTDSADNNNLDNPVMYRQNAAVIPLATPSFTLPADPILTGETLDLGQLDDIVLEIRTEMERC